MLRVFAHRGWPRAEPENTMASFRAAAEAGCDGIELDVQLSADGRLVVIHDESVDRTTDGSGQVRDLTLAELRRLDAGAGFARARGGPADPSARHAMPTLEEYLDFARGLDLVTDIELKNYLFEYPGLEERTIAAVRERGMEERVILSSFNHQSMALCRRLAPEIDAAFITGNWMIEAGDYCERHGARYFKPRFGYLTPANLAELEAHGVRAMAWTVDEASEAARLEAGGAWALITNDCAGILAALGRKR